MPPLLRLKVQIFWEAQKMKKIGRIFQNFVTFQDYVIFTKAELSQGGAFLCTQFPSLGIFTNKKVGFPKKYDHLVYNF